MQTDNYQTLEQIRQRKEELSEAIDQDQEKIAALWDGLFHRQEPSTKGEYIASIVTNSITAIDAFLLVRKLMKNYGHLLKLFKRKDKNKKKR
jgi:hypothetical protein